MNSGVTKGDESECSASIIDRSQFTVAICGRPSVRLLCSRRIFFCPRKGRKEEGATKSRKKFLLQGALVSLGHSRGYNLGFEASVVCLANRDGKLLLKRNLVAITVTFKRGTWEL